MGLTINLSDWETHQLLCPWGGGVLKGLAQVVRPTLNVGHTIALVRTQAQQKGEIQLCASFPSLRHDCGTV